MKTILALTVAIAVTPASAWASCDEDTLETVSDGGDTLVMQSGHVYQVEAGDTVDIQLWTATDDVLVCDDDEVINKDENGEKARTTVAELMRFRAMRGEQFVCEVAAETVDEAMRMTHNAYLRDVASFRQRHLVLAERSAARLRRLGPPDH